MSNTTSHNAELGGMPLSMATIHLFPKWFKMLCGILSNKQLLHAVKPSFAPYNAPNSQSYAGAVVQDPTLRSFTFISAPGYYDLYYAYSQIPYTFPGYKAEQFNVYQLITINLDPTFATTIPETNFAYDAIKFIFNIYQATASNSTVTP
ncbi:hypothetical protein HDU81_011251 [Chytriomyces hyalinus]|nr:hypothetical protein HDU81_011251 [Chytriomyces hyalinus]